MSSAETTSAFPWVPGAAPHRERDVPALIWIPVAVASALLLATAMSVKPMLAIGLAAMMAVVARAARRPNSILAILGVTIFLELFTVGGLTVTRAVAPIGVFVLVVQLLRGQAIIRSAAQLRWAIAYALWAIASGLWTVSEAGTSYMLQSLAIAFVFMLCFAGLPETREDVERVLSIIGYTALVVGGLSFLTFFGKIHIAAFLKAGRGSGGVGDPDFFSALLLAFLPVVLVVAAAAPIARRRLALYAASLVMIAAVLTSQSRGGAIGLIVVLLLLIAVPARALFRSRRQKLVGILCVVAAGAALIIHSPWAVLPRLETITGSPKNGAAAGSGRVEIWKAAAHSIRDHPLFGTGYGSFVYQSDYLMLNTNGVDLTYFYLRTPGSEAHNLYLGTWAELGLPGLLLYLGLMAATARSLRRTAVRAGRLGEDVVRRLANGLLLGLVSWAVTSFFLTTETARAFWIILGLSLALPRFLPGEQRSAQRAS